MMAGVLEAADEYAAVELLHDLSCTDGLPVIVPTQERVERMVLSSGLDGDMVLGEMGPNLGAATIERIAIAAVMAGCLPDHFPVVIAAVKAVSDPVFDLTEVQATTHCLAPLLLVNGPARAACGPIASGFGALGPGFRANAAIGRALRLCMINIGGGRPGTSDMALLGHPGKFTYCMAEAEETSPFEPLHVARGFAPEDSTVTVVGVEAPHSVICVTDADNPDSPLWLLRTLAGALANIGANNSHLRGGSAVVVLNPDHATVLADAGYDRHKIAEALCGLAGHKRGALRAINPAMAGRGSDDDFSACFRSPEDLVIVHGGGNGLYSMVMPSWCAGPHANRSVSKVIELNQACEIPGMRST
ncbi:MAG: hypothetical protein QOJ19_388 [Acidimicrobiia bacterium]|nr:hypothetical protein [Acidimicrobiia bacterium]